MNQEPDDLADMPIFVVEEEDKTGLYTIICNRAGFMVINEYLESYASDASEKDLMNPYCQ